MEILYQVIWHEENQTGVPEHVMSASPLLITGQAAEDWLNSTMAEDRERAGENEEDLLVENLGDGVWKTVGNNQHCFYRIETVERWDEAAELLEKADACIDDLNRIAHETAGGVACPAAVTRRILDYYRETGTKTCRRKAVNRLRKVAEGIGFGYVKRGTNDGDEHADESYDETGDGDE